MSCWAVKSHSWTTAAGGGLCRGIACLLYATDFLLTDFHHTALTRQIEEYKNTLYYSILYILHSCRVMS